MRSVSEFAVCARTCTCRRQDLEAIYIPLSTHAQVEQDLGDRECDEYENIYRIENDDGTVTFRSSNFDDDLYDGGSNYVRLCIKTETLGSKSDGVSMSVKIPAIVMFLAYLMYEYTVIDQAQTGLKPLILNAEKAAQEKLDQATDSDKQQAKLDLEHAKLNSRVLLTSFTANVLQMIMVEIVGFFLLFMGSATATDVILNSSAVMFLAEVDDIMAAVVSRTRCWLGSHRPHPEGGKMCRYCGPCAGRMNDPHPPPPARVLVGDSLRTPKIRGGD